jgi:branched-subunit amino acid aminotransferase/4-amino-4-deoxychorismate lyase
MPALLAYREGAYIPKNDIRIDLDDLGFERGFGVFDYMRLYQGRIPFLKDHLARLDHSQSVLNFAHPVRMEMVQEVITNLIEKNDQREGYFKVMITGRMQDGVPQPVVTIYQELYKPHPAESYSNGIKLIIAEYEKPYPEYKTTFYLGSFREMARMHAEKADDVLFYVGDIVRECARCNIFYVKSGLIYTPLEHILLGVTRKHVIASGLGKYMFIEAQVTMDRIFEADEVFISSTTRNIMPVTSIEDRMIGNGKPGYVTQELMEMFNTYFENYTG